MLQEKMHGGATAAGEDNRCRNYETIPPPSRGIDSLLDGPTRVYIYIRCRVPESVTNEDIKNASNTFFYGENGTISNQPNIATAEYYTGGFNRLGDDHNQAVVDAIVAKLTGRGGRSRRRHIRSRSKTSKKEKKRSFRRRRSLKNKTRKH